MKQNLSECTVQISFIYIFYSKTELYWVFIICIQLQFKYFRTKWSLEIFKDSRNKFSFDVENNFWKNKKVPSSRLSMQLRVRLLYKKSSIIAFVWLCVCSWNIFFFHFLQSEAYCGVFVRVLYLLPKNITLILRAKFWS